MKILRYYGKNHPYGWYKGKQASKLLDELIGDLLLEDLAIRDNSASHNKERINSMVNICEKFIKENKDSLYDTFINFITDLRK